MPPTSTRRSWLGWRSTRVGSSNWLRCASPCLRHHPGLGVVAERGGGLLRQADDKRLRRGSFCGVVDLQAAFIAEHNRTAKRFVWTADPDRIIENVNKAKRASGAYR
jgi:hypothetical protein